MTCIKHDQVTGIRMYVQFTHRTPRYCPASTHIKQQQPKQSALGLSPPVEVKLSSRINASCLKRQVAQLSQRNRAAAWVSFGWP